MSWVSEVGELTPDAAPPWLKPLVANAPHVKRAYRRRVPPEVLAVVMAANAKAAISGGGTVAAKRLAAAPYPPLSLNGCCFRRRARAQCG